MNSGLVSFSAQLQAGLHGRDLLGELVAVERHAGLEAQHVARAEAAGLEPFIAVVARAVRSKGSARRRSDEELEAVLTGVAGARDRSQARRRRVPRAQK